MASKKFVAALVASLAIVVGCFGKPAAVVDPIQGKEEVKVSSPVATQETAKPTPIVETSVTPTPAPVVAQDSEMRISDIRVGDADLSGAVRFTVQGAGKVEIHEEFTSPRLFRIDGKGRPILVSNTTVDMLGDAAGVTISASGSYLVAGKEKSLPFENEPLVLLPQEDVRQYATQGVGCENVDGGTLWITGPGGYSLAIHAWTRDTSFPSPVDVYIHHAAGGGNRPDKYSFQDLVEDVQPEGVVLNFIRDKWNTRLAPDVAAEAYNTRWQCGDPGRSRIDICQSAGCLKALVAMIRAYRELRHYWNHLGIEAVAPAFGGSHAQIKEIFDAWLSIMHKPARFGALFLLAQRDIGLLALPPKTELLLLKYLLAGTSHSLYNELGRTLAWDGTGTGIPTITYGRFSEHDFGIPYLQRKLTPMARFLTLNDNALAEYAPGAYVNHNAGGGTYFNYIEALGGYYTSVRDYWGKESGQKHLEKKVDVIVTHLDREDPSSARVFEATYSTNVLLTNAWQLRDPSSQYRLEFEKAAMPWLHEFIQEAPSVVPQPNENALNDGALTVAQQLGLKDGPSILVKSSDSVRVDEEVARSRLPAYIDEFKTFPGTDHVGAGVTNAEIRAQMRAWIVKRTKHLKDEETKYVLTEKDKDIMRKTFFPEPPVIRFYQGFQWKYEYGFGYPTLTFTQAPVRADQKNRVRMTGADWVDIRIYKEVEGVGYVFERSEKKYWKLEEDFIRRNGVWHLVIK